jgi:hypothetical protein
MAITAFSEAAIRSMDGHLHVGNALSLGPDAALRQMKSWARLRS